MKYNIGDKVRIKTWEMMEKEFGLNKTGGVIKYISCLGTFVKEMEKFLNELNCDRVLTIKEKGIWYYIEEGDFVWSDDMIECLYKEPIYKPINSRFDILDIRK